MKNLPCFISPPKYPSHAMPSHLCLLWPPPLPPLLGVQRILSNALWGKWLYMQNKLCTKNVTFLSRICELWLITPQCLSPTFFPIIESLAQAEKGYNPHAKEVQSWCNDFPGSLPQVYWMKNIAFPIYTNQRALATV